MSFSRDDVESYEKAAPVAAKEAETPTSEKSSPSEAVVKEDVVVEAENVDSTPTEEKVVVDAEPTPAEAEEAVVEPDEEGAPAAEKRKGGRAEERIQELLGDAAALRKYAEFWKDQAVKGTKPSTTGFLPETAAVTAPVGEESPPEAGEAPTLESCAFDTAKWTQAMATYNAKYLKSMAEYTQKQIQAGVASALVGQKQVESAEQVKASYEAKCTAWAATHPDFNMLISNPALPHLHRDAAELLLRSDLAAELTDYLARNPDKAERIARSTPAQQSAAVGRLEGELARPAVVAEAPVKVIPKKPTTLTKAPNPPSRTPAGASPGKSQEELMAGPMDDWVAHERAQEKTRRDNLRKQRIKR
jgi:hypothetical protein